MYRYKLNKEKIKENYKSIQGITLSSKEWFNNKSQLSQLKPYIENQVVIEEILDDSNRIISSSYIKKEKVTRKIKKTEPEIIIEKEVFKTPEFDGIKNEEIEEEKVDEYLESFDKAKEEFSIKKDEGYISENTVKMMDKSIENYKKKLRDDNKKTKVRDIDLNDYFLTF